MTSKEKLDYIISTTPYIDQDVKLANNYAKDIEKDLELLDIIKFLIQKSDIVVNPDLFVDYPELYEWLEQK